MIKSQIKDRRSLMKRSALICHVTAFVLYLVGALMYGCILGSHIKTTLAEIKMIPGGGYELVPSTENIDKVIPHIVITALLLVFFIAALIMLIKRKTSVVLFAASAIMIIIAYLITDTGVAEFTFVKNTLGIVGAAETYVLFKFIPFAASAIAASASFILDKTAQTKNA